MLQAQCYFSFTFIFFFFFSTFSFQLQFGGVLATQKRLCQVQETVMVSVQAALLAADTWVLIVSAWNTL